MSVATPRLSVREKISYGLGDSASNFYFQFFNLYLVYYYTDIVKINAAKVATLMVTVRIFDAILDPTVGIIADRTTSRWGKFRPYILFGSVPFGVLGFIMFLTPSYSEQGKLVYAYLTYGLMWLAYTAVNIPYSSLMGVMSPSSEDRTSLSTYRFVCAFGAAAVIGPCMPWLKDVIGKGDEAMGIRIAMLGFSIVAVVMFLFTFANTKERVHPPVDQDRNMGKDLKNLFRNGPWVTLFFAALFILISAAIRNGSIIFYFKYAALSEGRVFWYSLAGTLSFLVGAISTKFFLRLGSRKTLITVLYSLNAVFMGAAYFVNPQSQGLLIVLNIAANLLAGPTPAILWSMYADVADYSEWRFHRRSTGLIFSGSVFSQKVGLAFGSGALAQLLYVFGFAANQAQTVHAITGIKLVFSLLPAAFGILGAIAILFYPITEPMIKTIESDLTARKAAAEPAGVLS